MTVATPDAVRTRSGSIRSPRMPRASLETVIPPQYPATAIPANAVPNPRPSVRRMKAHAPVPAATPAYKKKTVTERAATIRFPSADGRRVDRVPTGSRAATVATNATASSRSAAASVPNADPPRCANRDEGGQEQGADRRADAERRMDDTHRSGAPVNGNVGVHTGVEHAPCDTE